MRYRINKIVSLLEKDNLQAVRSLYESSSKYRKAFNALVDQGVISAMYGDDHLSEFWLNTSKSAAYSLSRHDVWANRLIGFAAGVATSVIASFIIQSLSGL